MHFRFRLLIVILFSLSLLVGCKSNPLGRASAPTPFPTKTLRPTFTNTPAQPTAAPPTATLPASPTPWPSPTPEPPTAPPPTPTPERPSFTVVEPLVNVRSGPGTNYPRIGQVRQGQTFEITGKNPAGDWWQFNYNGQPAWIIGRLVSARATESVPVASNIPAPPPPPRPAPTATRAPTSTPAPAYAFEQAGQVNKFPNTNPVITVWCLVWNRAGNGLVAGTLRVTGAYNPPDAHFTEQPAYNDPFEQVPINSGSKIEWPYIPGNYSVFLVDPAGNQISPAYNFTVDGEIRKFVFKWKQK